MQTLVGVKRNLWRTQQGRVSRMNFPIDPLVLHLPLWHPELSGSPFLSKDLNPHTCTVFGATWTSLGRSFDGVNDYVNCGDALSLDITTAITIEAWINITAYPAVSAHLAGRDDGTNRNFNLLLRLTAPTAVVDFNVWINNTPRGISSTSCSLATWYHLVATYNGAYENIYKNGLLDATPIAYTGAIDNDDVSFTTGCRAVLIDRDYNGLIGEVRIYNRALSAPEILHNYLATKWRYQ